MNLWTTFNYELFDKYYYISSISSLSSQYYSKSKINVYISGVLKFISSSKFIVLSVYDKYYLSYNVLNELLIFVYWIF